jgi:hypothetical protein
VNGTEKRVKNFGVTFLGLEPNSMSISLYFPFKGKVGRGVKMKDSFDGT